MNFFEKLDKNPYEDLYWNIPETKQGSVAIIGGNKQSFRTPVKTAEYLAAAWPVKEVKLVLPDALKKSLPELPEMVFLPSTEAGSFAGFKGISNAINAVDYSVLIGDLSRNSETIKAIRSALEITEKPLIITRDTVDLIAEPGAERLLMNENLVIMGSVAQLTKLLRAVYYPKMLLMSQSLVQVTEVLHKFTLSYPVSIVTLHNDTILVAKNGNVKGVALEKTNFSPMTFWDGRLAVSIAAINLYSPGDFVKATVAEICRSY